MWAGLTPNDLLRAEHLDLAELLEVGHVEGVDLRNRVSQHGCYELGVERPLPGHGLLAPEFLDHRLDGAGHRLGQVVDVDLLHTTPPFLNPRAPAARVPAVAPGVHERTPLLCVARPAPGSYRASMEVAADSARPRFR